MSHYLIEFYTPNAAWKTLPIEKRHQFLDAIQGAMENLSNLGRDAADTRWQYAIRRLTRGARGKSGAYCAGWSMEPPAHEILYHAVS